MVPMFGSGIMVGVNHPHRFGDPNCSFRIGKLVIQTAHFRAQNNSHTVKFSVSEFKLLKCVKRQTWWPINACYDHLRSQSSIKPHSLWGNPPEKCQWNCSNQPQKRWYILLMVQKSGWPNDVVNIPLLTRGCKISSINNMYIYTYWFPIRINRSCK